MNLVVFVCAVSPFRPPNLSIMGLHRTISLPPLPSYLRFFFFNSLLNYGILFLNDQKGF